MWQWGSRITQILSRGVPHPTPTPTPPPALTEVPSPIFGFEKEIITHTVSSVTMGEVGWHLRQSRKKTPLSLAISGKKRLQMLAQGATGTHSSSSLRERNFA
ncbi:hypothetical protein STEG23_008713 [Scotinomys teguina]